MKKSRIVVKVGTSTLTYPNGRLQLGQIERLVRELSDLVNEGHEVVLVTSGAIGAGMSRLGMDKRPVTIPEKQAVAAVGQGMLMQVYAKIFAEYCHVCAQVLLTAEDLQQRNRYLNCGNTLENLLHKRVVPIVNENDSVAVDEIKFGDNDRLSAMVANLINADLLVVLSDIDGVYDKDPREYPNAQLIPVIAEVTKDIESLAGGVGSLGTGGMATKFQAAKIARCSGIPMVITNGSKPGLLGQLVAGQSVGTLFSPQTVAWPSRKRWLAFYTHPHGQIVVDDGAQQALKAGKSLLPAGVLRCTGSFNAGDLVQIVSEHGHEIARGLSYYSAQEVASIKGQISSAVEDILPNHPFDEVIHRDNMVMMDMLERRECHGDR